jgi:hypothetical protein
VAGLEFFLVLDALGSEEIPVGNRIREFSATYSR